MTTRKRDGFGRGFGKLKKLLNPESASDVFPCKNKGQTYHMLHLSPYRTTESLI